MKIALQPDPLQSPPPLDQKSLKDPVACEKMRAAILNLGPGEALEFFRAPHGSLRFAPAPPLLAYAGLMKTILTLRDSDAAIFTQAVFCAETPYSPAVFSHFVQMKKES